MTDESKVFLELGLPPVPVLAEGVLELWYGSHEAASAALESLGSCVGQAFTDWRFERCLEGLAGVTPSLSGAVDPVLLPVPRRFLSVHDLERIAGCRAGIEHVDVRHQLIDDGLENTLIRPETPYVLHALVEGRATGVDITNPGMPRVRPTGWSIRDNKYQLPPPEMTRPLVELIIEVLDARVAPPPALGAWAAFTFLSVHPFVDGNGRLARLLYLAVASNSLPHLDLGVFEQVAQNRHGYVNTLQLGQQTTPHWDPRKLDAGPFVSAMIGWSAAGADRQCEQIHAVDIACQQLLDRFPGLDDDGLGSLIGVWLNRGSKLTSPGSDPSAGGDRPNCPVGRKLEELASAGLVERVTEPPSRRVGGRTGLVYQMTPSAAAVLQKVGVRRIAPTDTNDS
ncbi:MAG TPA: Fic family protein [Microthrixaceae bacterium]|nr:Fic family protein [Microthrixaceae bacterium]